MIVRKASRALAQVPVTPALAERRAAGAAEAPAKPEPTFDALDWRGDVRLDAARALGTPAPRYQQYVRTGLLERAVTLGEGHREEPHEGRPDAARRLLAHIDALAEAGLSFADLTAFSETADLESPGVLWTVTILFGVLDLPGAEIAFEAWIRAVDEASFEDYPRVIAIADALRTQPNGALRARAEGWWNDPSPVLRALAVELLRPEDLDLTAAPPGRSGGAGQRLSRAAADRSTLGLAAFERLLARLPAGALPPMARPSWTDIGVPSAAFEVARARVLRGDPEPLARLRDRHSPALAALGPFAMDLLALAGDASDDDLARDLALGLPTTPALLDAMGRAGLPGLFPRLLAELSGDDFDDEARRALTTVLGPRAPEGAAARAARSWEEAIAALTEGAGPANARPPAAPGRLRGGHPWSLGAVIAEMQRPDLSAREVQDRAFEVLSRTGKTVPVDWDAVGVSLESAIRAITLLVR